MNYNFKYPDNEAFFNNLVKKLNETDLITKIQDLYEKKIVLTVNETHFFIEEVIQSIHGTSPTPPVYYALSIRKEDEKIESNDFFKIQYLSENEKIEMCLNYIKENL